MIKVRLALVLTTAAVGIGACGGDEGRAVRTVTAAAETPAQESSAAARGDAILIQTRVTNAKRHTGEVLAGSVIGDSSFCPGGKTSGGSNGPTITTTFRCSGGTLKVQFAPIQRSLVQGAVWGVLSGTGSFKGLRGGGSMVAKFESDNPDVGRETFTGTVGK